MMCLMCVNVFDVCVCVCDDVLDVFCVCDDVFNVFDVCLMCWI